MSQVKFTEGNALLRSMSRRSTQYRPISDENRCEFDFLRVPSLKFSLSCVCLPGERVLCYHGQLIYEAKLLKTQVKDRTVKYYIHYAGWSKNWDEWVGESRVLKYNEENVQKQKEIEKKVASSSKNAKKTPKATTKKRFVVDFESSFALC